MVGQLYIAVVLGLAQHSCMMIFLQASCSPLFRRILSNNAEKPLLYLKGINKRELTAVLNFMYHGEVNVAEDSLNVFLAVAEELAIKGLATNVTTRFDGSSSASAPAEIFSASYDE